MSLVCSAFVNIAALCSRDPRTRSLLMLAILAECSGACSGSHDPTAGNDSSLDSPSDTSVSAHVCVPGQQVACACPGGTLGAQRCNDEGAVFESCICLDQGDGTTHDGALLDVPSGVDRGDISPDMHATDAGTSDSGPDGNSDIALTDATPSFALRVENYNEECSITLNGMDLGSQTLTFPAGAVVILNGQSSNPLFRWGYWVGTAGDTSAVHDTQPETSVTMTKNTVVQACCPFEGESFCPPPSP
jgi:hypothetical protein